MSNRRERWGIVAFNTRTFQGALQLPKQIIGQVIRLMREKKEAQAG